MSLAKKRTPYKLVIRWSDDGVIDRASMNYMTRVTEDGAVISESMEETPITDIGAQLGEVIGQVNAEAMAELDRLRARIFELEPAYADARRQVEEHKAECSGLRQELEKLLDEKARDAAAAREMARERMEVAQRQPPETPSAVPAP